MASSEKAWGLQKISSVAAAVKELRYLLRMSLEDIGQLLGVNQSMVHRYEAGKSRPPAPVLIGLTKLSIEKELPVVITRAFIKELAPLTGMSEFAVTLAALLTLEGPDAPKHVARLAKRAAELLG